MHARPAPAARLLALAVGAVLVLLLAAFLGARGTPAAHAQSPEPGTPRVVVAFFPLPDVPPADDQVEPPLAFRPILDRLDARPQLSLGLSSAAQGQYDPTQALLDISQGTRVSLSTYDPKRPPNLTFVAQGRGALFQGWLDEILRADSAPAEVEPGLLGASVPGGAAYAGVRGRAQREAIAAANRAGRIGTVSIGPADDVAARARRLLPDHQLVVVGLPTGIAGDLALDRLLDARAANELLIVMQTPPDQKGAQLLPTGIAGLPGAPGQLTSETTHLDGVIAGIDVLPTVLDHLGLPVPSTVKGQPMTVVPGRDAGALESLADRLRVVFPRRLPALWTLLGAWLILLLTASLIADRRGLRWAMRVGGLAVLWVPAAVLLTAALRPSRTLELLLISLISLVAATITDRLVPFPRGPAVPALVGVVAYIVDLVLGSPLIIRSVLGPNPLFGSRFYGIGNELEAGLSALLLIGIGALLFGRGRSRAGVAVFACCGLVLGIAMGAGRLGADVGGVMTLGAGAATAAALMLPGGVTKRALVVVVGAPLAALVLLAAIDLTTGGDSHFTRTVLRADGSGALWDIVSRRYELAGRALIRGFMPAATLIAVLAIALGFKERRSALASVGGDAGYRAALGGVLAVGVGGAVFNDSGPVLLLFATFLAACTVVYLRGAATAPAAPGAAAQAIAHVAPVEGGGAGAPRDPAPTAR